ncbi:MAG: hypothetical protein LGR52_14825 [Candidatus Thiosymbion ectosymbiont of Robbea hypermnestra]|nr:hypothetical protein [Candidatus Thiosymbion ectosymbiont of Robbea hypermnestra]
MRQFKWRKIEELQNEILALEFRDCKHGWRSEVELPVPGTTRSTTWYEGSTTFIKETRDGGENWASIHAGGDLFERLRYQESNGSLWAIRVAHDSAGGKLSLAFSLAVSDDGGRRWRKYCALPHGTEDFLFLDGRKGYAWTVGTIYATSDSGEHWHKLSKTEISAAIKARMERVGVDDTFYFIRSGQVFGINPWIGTETTIPLPDDFEPRMLSVSKARNRLFVLGRTFRQWRLLVLEDNKTMSLSDVPLGHEWSPEALVQSDEILNLIGSRILSFITERYYFLVMDKHGWDTESISGSTTVR